MPPPIPKIPLASPAAKPIAKSMRVSCIIRSVFVIELFFDENYNYFHNKFINNIDRYDNNSLDWLFIFNSVFAFS